MQARPVTVTQKETVLKMQRFPAYMIPYPLYPVTSKAY